MPFFINLHLFIYLSIPVSFFLCFYLLGFSCFSFISLHQLSATSLMHVSAMKVSRHLHHVLKCGRCVRGCWPFTVCTHSFSNSTMAHRIERSPSYTHACTGLGFSQHHPHLALHILPPHRLSCSISFPSKPDSLFLITLVVSGFCI